MRRDDRGGSLVEVLAVVTVVSLLASLVVAAMQGVFPRARIVTWCASMKNLQGATDLFYARWGTYPVAGGQPLPEGHLASLLDLQARGGDGAPFSAGLRSVPPDDAAQAGLAAAPARLYYGVNHRGRVFATTSPPPWTGDTTVFLPEHPGGIALSRVGRAVAALPGQGDTGGSGEQPAAGGGGTQSPGSGGGAGDQPGSGGGAGDQPGSGGGAGDQPGSDSGADDAGSGGEVATEVILGPGGVSPVVMLGVEERAGALVPARGPTLAPHDSLPVPVAGAGAAVLANGLYLLGGRGNADRVLYRAAPEAEWQLLPTRLPYEVPAATVATVGGNAYLLGGSAQDCGRGIWEYRGTPGPLRQLACGFPAPLVEPAACGSGGRVYVFGGWLGGVRSAAIFVLDPACETLAKLPASLPFALSGAAAVALGEHIYLFGGETATGWSDHILAFSPLTGTVHDTGYRLPQGTARVAASVLDGIVYLTGGASGDVRNPTALDTVWSFRPGQGVTRLSPALSFAPGRWAAAAATWGEQVYFCGGAGGPAVEMAQVLRLAMREGSPRPAVTLDAQLSCMGAVAGRGSDLYVLGGTPWLAATDEVRRVIPADARVQVLGFRLPRPAINAPCVRVGNRIFIFGGRTWAGIGNHRLTEIGVVDLDTGTGTVARYLPWRVEGMAAAEWHGKVYLFGGLTDGGVTDRIFEFDPVSYSLRELAVRLPSRRFNAGAAGGSGGIWLVGGRGEAGLLDEVFLFDPAQGVLREVARLPVQLERAAAVTWRDRLYVLGGAGSGGRSARILEVAGAGAVSELPCRLPYPACGVAVPVDDRLYFVEDGGVVLEVVPQPRVTWVVDGARAGTWSVIEVRAEGDVAVTFRTSPDGVSWTDRLREPSSLPPARYLEVEASLPPDASARLESIHLLHR